MRYANDGLEVDKRREGGREVTMLIRMIAMVEVDGSEVAMRKIVNLDFV